MLRYQLNPHFLFNTLNAISSLVRASEGEKANQMIVQLSDFFRYSLDHDPKDLVDLSAEVDALEKYLNIEQTRFEERLKVEIQVDDDAKMARVPSLLLQPLVENSIKYAIAPSVDGGKISMRASRVADNLSIELWDVGSKADEVALANAQSNTGVGLSNTRERLRAHFGDDYQFDVALKNGGVAVSLLMPFNVDAKLAG